MEELNKLYRALLLLNASLFEIDKLSDKNLFKIEHQEVLQELENKLDSIVNDLSKEFDAVESDNYSYILSKLNKIIQNSKLKSK
jgi:hypothetical protein